MCLGNIGTCSIDDPVIYSKAVTDNAPCFLSKKNIAVNPYIKGSYLNKSFMKQG